MIYSYSSSIHISEVFAEKPWIASYRSIKIEFQSGPRKLNRSRFSSTLGRIASESRDRVRPRPPDGAVRRRCCRAVGLQRGTRNAVSRTLALTLPALSPSVRSLLSSVPFAVAISAATAAVKSAATEPSPTAPPSAQLRLALLFVSDPLPTSADLRYSSSELLAVRHCRSAAELSGRRDEGDAGVGFPLFCSSKSLR